MREIVLSNRKKCKVDDSDFQFLSQFSWSESKSLNTSYAICRAWIGNRWHSLTMHRLIMKLSKRHVDHINGDGLDNRRSNLRFCTQSQNAANARNKKRKAPYRGVTKTKYGRYHARATIDGRREHLGVFDCPKEAARAYDKRVKERWGKFATTNF